MRDKAALAINLAHPATIPTTKNDNQTRPIGTIEAHGKKRA
jgi:hypothetical protein